MIAFLSHAEELLYAHLNKYILEEDELVENGYPRASPTAPGTAIINKKKSQRVMKDRKSSSEQKTVLNTDTESESCTRDCYYQ